MPSRVIRLLVAAAFFSTAHSQPARVERPDGTMMDTTAIHRIVQGLMDTANVTGLCLGLIHDGNAAFVHGYGFKDHTTGTRNDTATCFSGASFSKAVFAYLFMQLRDAGLIDLDKPLSAYLPKPLPEYDNYKDLAGDGRWQRITARNCLDHTTGFPNWRQLNPNDNGKLEIFFTPGSRFAYSGEGFRLLQMVVETITRRPLEDLAQAYVFRPLGMRRSGYVWHTAYEDDYAVGHDAHQRPLPKEKHATANAASSLETTIADWTRFLGAIMEGTGLSRESRREIFSPQIGISTKREFPSLNTDTTSDYTAIQLSYGLGWGLFKSSHGWAFFKEGHDDGWQHYSIGFPASRQAMVVMTNSDRGESIFKELLEKVYGVTIPWQWEGYTPFSTTAPGNK